MLQKTPINTIVGVLILLLVAAGAGYYIRMQANITPSSPDLAADQDRTAEWKTYRNEQYRPLTK
ncbi:MAG: hypothetical protein G01um101433_573 [Parcubacteria group bacterium Gr01-1014_33]|nr:MAG: hypothetical protein G01um101433_573 [Parcubacteria group bacterium Gr01-1014_33]